MDRIPALYNHSGRPVMWRDLADKPDASIPRILTPDMPEWHYRGLMPYMVWADMTDKATNDLITETEWDKIKDNFAVLKTHTHDGTTGGGGTLTLGLTGIAENEVTGAAVASISFSSIPATYATLIVNGIIRPVNDQVALYLRVNGDTGNTYHWANLFQSQTATTGADTAVTAVGQIEVITDDVAAYQLANDATFAAAINIIIPRYASTTLIKPIMYTFSYLNESVGAAAGSGGGVWVSTAAINQLTFLMSAGNVDIGTHLMLYGVKDF